MIEPTFNPRILDTFIPVFDQQSKILVQQLGNQAGAKEIDIFKYISLCTLDMICGNYLTWFTEQKLSNKKK